MREEEEEVGGQKDTQRKGHIEGHTRDKGRKMDKTNRKEEGEGEIETNRERERVRQTQRGGWDERRLERGGWGFEKLFRPKTVEARGWF